MNPSIVIITGLPGSGKSRLIEELSHRLAQKGERSHYIALEPGPFFYDSWTMSGPLKHLPTGVDCQEVVSIDPARILESSAAQKIFLEVSGSCFSNSLKGSFSESLQTVHLSGKDRKFQSKWEQELIDGADLVAIHPSRKDLFSLSSNAMELDLEESGTIDRLFDHLFDGKTRDLPIPRHLTLNSGVISGVVQLDASIASSFAYSPAGVITTFLSSILELLERREATIYHMKAAIRDPGDELALEGSVPENGGAIVWKNYRRKLRFDHGQMRASLSTSVNPDELEMLVKMILDNVALENDIEFENIQTASVQPHMSNQAQT